jgi:hypothetical protein
LATHREGSFGFRHALHPGERTMEDGGWADCWLRGTWGKMEHACTSQENVQGRTALVMPAI